MKNTCLILAALLMATSSIAQYITPEEIPIKKDYKIVDCWGMSVVGDKLIMTGNTITNKNYQLFGPYIYYDGVNPTQNVPNNIMQDVEVGNLSHIEHPPYGKYYFNGWGKDTGGIYTWDGINPVEKIVSHEPNSSGFSKGVSIGSKIYYVQYNSGANRACNLWVVDVDDKTLKKLTNDEYHIYKLKVFNDKVYLFEYHKPNYLHCYDPATGQITDIETGLAKDEDSDIGDIVQVNNKLIFSLGTKALGQELYEYDGEGSVHLIKDLAKGKYDGVGNEVKLYNGKIYFAGNVSTQSEHGVFDLYSYEPNAERINLIKEIHVGEDYGSFPHRFYLAFGNLYFTARAIENELQVYEYTSTTDQLKQLTNMPKQDGISFYPTVTTAWDGFLYITAYAGIGNIGGKFRKTVMERGIKIYRIKPEQKPTNINSKHITELKVTAHPNPTASNTTLNIEIPKASKLHLAVTDATGKQVYEHHTLGILQRHRIEVPMQQLAAGIYLYQLTNDSGVLLNSGRLAKQ